MTPVSVNANSVGAQGTSWNIQSQYQYVDGYSPIRSGLYCYWGYVRFQLAAPQGTGIENAIINFYTYGGQASILFNWDIYGIAADNVSSTPAGTAYPPSGTAFCNLPRTTAYATWALPSGTPGVGVLRQTPDIGPILSEIVARPGWVSGNYVGLWIASNFTQSCTVFYGTPYSPTSTGGPYGSFPSYNIGNNYHSFASQTNPTPAYRPAGTGDYVDPPAAPTASASPGRRKNFISWSSVVGATSYNIYWSYFPGVTTADTKITGATSTYTHPGLDAFIPIYYIVTAVNTAPTYELESLPSNEVSATPSDINFSSAEIIW